MTGMRLIEPTCLILVASLLATSCATDPQAATVAYLESGDTYVSQEKYREAMIEYRNAVQQDPRSGVARSKLAEAYLRANEAAHALTEYVRAADLMPDNAEAQLKAGQVLLLARRFEDARARADTVLTSDPRHVQAQVLRGHALAGLQDVAGAIAQIEEAISVDPDRISSYESLGALQLASGNLQRAEDAFTKAVQIDVTSARARLSLAVFYLSSGRHAEAETTLRQTLAIEASEPMAHRLLALVYLASNRAPDAEPHLQTVADVTRSVAARLALADYYTRMRRTSEAVSTLNAVDAKDPQAFAAAQTRLAAIEYSNGQTTDAHRRLDDLLAAQPKSVASLVLKAQLLLTERRLDQGLAKAKAATEADPASAPAQVVLGKLHAANHQLDQAVAAFNEALRLDPRATAVHVELSRVQFASGHLEASVESARQALKRVPDDLEARLLMVRGLLARGELPEVERELKTLLAQYPKVSAVHGQRGLLQLAKGDQTGARRSFERALALDHDSFDGLSGVVRLDLVNQNAAAAQSRIETRLTQNPDDARLLLLGAQTYLATGEPHLAEQTLRRVIALDPSTLQAYSMLGELFMSQQKLEEAKTQFEAIARRWPASTAAIAADTTVAVLLQALNRPAQAQKKYQQILAASPRAIVAANNLAWLYAEHGGDLNAALGLAQIAVQQAPDHADINYTLGLIYYKRRLSTQAIAALQRSVQSAPSNPYYRYFLGLAYLQGSDRTRAKECLLAALTLNPAFDRASHAKTLLASLTE